MIRVPITRDRERSLIKWYDLAMYRDRTPRIRGKGRGLISRCARILAVFLGSAAALNSCRAADDRDRELRSPIVFREVAAQAGISFRFEHGSRGKHDLPEIMGGGVALFDADGDGLLDVYLCNGGPIDDAPGQTRSSLPAVSQSG